MDAGAGEMRYKPYCKHLNYISQDFCGYNPNEKKGICDSDKWDTSGVDIISDIIDIPMDDCSVDAILCSEVFEHLKNPVLAIKEFSRIIKTGGELILTAPFCCLTHMAPYFFYNGFSEYWYKEHLKDYGFEIEEIEPYGNFFQYLNQELLRLPKVIEKYCGMEMGKDDIQKVSEVMKALLKYQENDSGSSEILCFGIMVKAKRILSDM